MQSIANDLEAQLDIFFDEKSIIVGDSVTQKIDEGLEGCDAVLLCLSVGSIQSEWVRREYSYAMHARKKVIPLRLDDSSPPPVLRDIKYVDYSKGHEACIQSIMLSVDLTD